MAEKDDLAKKDDSAVLGAEARTRQRDQAASDLTRGLLIINGGGAAALLAFLAAIWPKEKGGALAEPTIWALWMLAVGAAAAAVHPFFRYEASLKYQFKGRLKGEQYRRLYVGSAILSILCFLGGMSVLAFYAWRAL